MQLSWVEQDRRYETGEKKENVRLCIGGSIEIRCSGHLVWQPSLIAPPLVCVCVSVWVSVCVCVSVYMIILVYTYPPIYISPLARSRPSKIPTHALFLTASNMLPITHTSLSASFSFLSVLFFFFCTTTTSSQNVCMGASHSCFSPVCRSKRR